MKLTLAIPTYNRAPFLDLLLASIAEQLPPVLDQVEIVVSDNASSDETPLVVQRHAGRMKIEYVRRAGNIGPDLNFAKLFLEARGEYVWIIGDDDILLPNALRAVFDTITELSPGIIFAQQVGFFDTIDIRAHSNRKVIARVLDQRLFVERVNVFLSFISSIVVNKAALAGQLDADGVLGLAKERSGFPQYAWVLPAVLIDSGAVHIATELVASRSGNAAGYAAFQVFIENQNVLLERYLSGRPDLIRIINNRALVRFFPNRIMRGKLGPGMVDENEAEIAGLFRARYSNNARYWLLVWPLLKAPRWLRWPLRLYQWGALFFIEAALWSRIRLFGTVHRFRY